MTALPLARIGLEQFRTRQAKAYEVVRHGKMASAQAEAHLRPWAAIATLCGADLPELAGIFADLRADLAEADWHPGVARWIIAEEICPRARWVPMFAAARDAAMDRLHLDDSPEAIASAAALHRIAVALAYDINGHVIPPYDAIKRIERAKAAHPERKAA